MTTERLGQGMAARIILETTIQQEDEFFKHSFDEMGRIVSMNNHYYLRFEEMQGKNKVPTLIKISSEGTVSLTRHAENKTRLEFNGEEPTYANYRTPAGIMKLRVKTNRMDISYQKIPFAGEVEIDYVLYNGDLPLGNYQIRLRFTT